MYRFKLEALLNHRRHQEEACQIEMAEAQRELSAVRKELSRLRKEKRTNIQELQTRQQESKKAADILLFVTYLEKLSDEIENQISRLQNATHKVNQKRDDLVAVMKKRKTLEKLKEKGWLAYQYRQLQEERKFNDEIAATRYVRKG